MARTVEARIADDTCNEGQCPDITVPDAELFRPDGHVCPDGIRKTRKMGLPDHLRRLAPAPSCGHLIGVVPWTIL
jgi:hypothetical protein